jgi:hypothetical protein
MMIALLATAAVAMLAPDVASARGGLGGGGASVAPRSAEAVASVGPRSVVVAASVGPRWAGAFVQSQLAEVVSVQPQSTGVVSVQPPLVQALSSAPQPLVASA